MTMFIFVFLKWKCLNTSSDVNKFPIKLLGHHPWLGLHLGLRAWAVSAFDFRNACIHRGTTWTSTISYIRN